MTASVQPNTTPRAMFGATVLVVLIALGLAGGRVQSVAGRRVLVIGDSLTRGSTSHLQQTLHANGWEPEVIGFGGYSIGTWEPIAAKVARFGRPDIAVVELGTNNCARGCRSLGGEIDVVVRGLLDAGVQRVLWVNVQEDSPYPINPHFVNQEIERAIVRWPQVSMIDLNTTFAGHPEWHAADRIHFNDAGQQVYAELVVRALRDDTS